MEREQYPMEQAKHPNDWGMMDEKREAARDRKTLRRNIIEWARSMIRFIEDHSQASTAPREKRGLHISVDKKVLERDDYRKLMEKADSLDLKLPTITLDAEEYNATTISDLEGLIETIKEEEEKSRILNVPEERPEEKKLSKESKETKDFLTPAIKEFQGLFQERAREFGKTLPPLETPKIPESLTKEHLEAIGEVFGKGNLELALMPKPKDLTPDYWDTMYPKTQREEDTKRRLDSYRPFEWSRQVPGSNPSSKTYGELFMGLMEKQAKGLGANLFLVETLPKPNYTDGKQAYGSIEGKNRTLDPLVPYLQKVWGKDYRFSSPPDKIEKELIPKIEEAIKAKFREKGLKDIDLKVILPPALLYNAFTTLKHPEISSTNTTEVTSTDFIEEDGSDRNYSLLAGLPGDGGSSYLYAAPRSEADLGRGFRLSLVFPNH